MSLLIDLFGYLSIVVHGLTIVAQSVAIGSVLFLILLARPKAWLLGDAGPLIVGDTIRFAVWSALALALCEAVTIALQGAVLVETVDLTWGNVLEASFATAGLVKMGAALVVVLALTWGGTRVSSVWLLAAAVVELFAATLTTHAAARLDNRGPLLVATGLHQLGAAIWIGGIPMFVAALARVHEGGAWREIGSRFSRLSMAGVVCILVSGVAMSIAYIGSWDASYGTAYGVMVGAKIAMFGALLLLGLGNFLVTEHLRRDPEGSVLRMKRFAEVEIGIGVTIFFAAASLTSVPPAVDLTEDRVTWAEIAERNTPELPRMTSPDHDVLAIPALQSKLDAEAAARATAPKPAFVPGSGELPVRNAADIAWSEYNHHWAGVFVVLIGFLALLNQAGLRWARHWPLLFLGLAVFLFLRSDPEVWPLGEEGFFVAFRDVEVVQHRFFVIITVLFGLFEWRVRTGRSRSRWAPLVFPLVGAAGGAALLTHQHAIANVKDQLLIELTHTPLALAAMAAGWARWLEIRADGRTARIAGWVWPAMFVLIGVILLWYRES
ncbi:MAG TPA: CopD family protein [Acetobacteraceae bacterium]|nr:CopD family protein [Acetobacteraceae bacterium]